MLVYSIINKTYQIKNKKKKIEIFKIQSKKKDTSKIKIKFKNYLVNKSSFKYKKSREQYAVSIINNKWTLINETIIPKVFEFFFFYKNISTNQSLNKIYKFEFFKIQIS